MKRKLKILIAAILVGVILILIELFSSTNVKNNTITNESVSSPQNTLEIEIKSIKNREFSPILFSTINSKIHASSANGLFSKSTEYFLKSELKDEYSKLLFIKCESYLMNKKGNSNTLINWLNDFNRNFKDSKAGYYISQINAYNYYSHDFIDKINSFTSKKCFDGDNYNIIRNELSNLSRLDQKFKSSVIITKMKSSRLKQLQEFYIYCIDPDNQILDCSNEQVGI